MEKFEFTKKPEEEKIPENVVLIEKSEARYRIVYGRHNKEQKSEDIGSADAIILETGADGYFTRKSAEDLIDNYREYDIQYKKIFEKAEKEKKPIYFIDIGAGEAAMALEGILRNIEVAAGLGLLAWLTKDENKKTTRREFLKNSLKGIGGLFLSSGLLADISSIARGEEIDEKSGRRVINKFIGSLHEGIHPETEGVVFALRNYLMAQKMSTISQEFLNLGKKPELAIIIGSAHHGIEKAFEENSEKRMEKIKKFLKTPNLEKVRERISTIAAFNFNKKEGKWEVNKFLKDPHLAKIENVKN